MGVLLLDSINQPADLKQLNEKQVEQLCEEIRSFLLKNISKTGGHLASNLGMVELTVALHRVLETPQDKIVFDVGHQCYTHKILTGRRGQFEQLRQLDGISGFPKPERKCARCIYCRAWQHSPFACYWHGMGQKAAS